MFNLCSGCIFEGIGLRHFPMLYFRGEHMDTRELVKSLPASHQTAVHEMLSAPWLCGAGKTAYRKLIEQLVLEHVASTDTLARPIRT
jgi:hypothetical protein